MKKIILLGAIIVLAACSQNKIEKLEAEQKELENEIEKFNKIGEKYDAPCQESVKLYQKARESNSENAESLKNKGAEICQKAFDAQNKVLDLQSKIVNIQMSIIAEKSK